MKNKKMVIPIIAVLAIICICIGFVCIKKYSPNKTRMSLKKYFQAQEGEVQVIVQDTLSESKAILSGGKVYVGVNLTKNEINSRFYWDGNENKLLYTTPTAEITVNRESKAYYTNKSKAEVNYPIVKTKGQYTYIALDFIKQYTAMDYKLYKNPDRVVITNKYNQDISYATCDSDTVMRYQPSIKSEILMDVKEKTELMVLDSKETETGFMKVMSKDGVTGYVKKKDFDSIATKKLTTDFRQETYSHIQFKGKVKLAWHQVTNQSANDNLLNLLNSAKGVNVVSPTWFSVSGNSGAITSLASDTYVERAHQADVQVWGLCNDFSNDSKIATVLSHTSSRQKLAKNLVAEAIRYSLDGINIDFEHIKKDNGNDFIQFIREMGIMCRNNGIILSVDNYPPTSYSRYYNRAEQAAVADYVITMAYDEYYAGSKEAGPVSSISYVQDATKNTVAEVPAKQSIIALPFYCRLWKEKTKDGSVKLSSEVYSMKNALNAYEGSGAKPAWDDATKMYYVEYNKGNALYKMWMEDEKSLTEKIKAATGSKVGGLAFWKLGLEKPAVWNTINKYTN